MLAKWRERREAGAMKERVDAIFGQKIVQPPSSRKQAAQFVAFMFVVCAITAAWIWVIGWGIYEVILALH